ncbi:MAG TPA: lmo0937 family membrane protein [Kofleriaceae bacterium]|nr:lmo0937 family membrane protein [Kofleriaceae bacterium]
MLLILAIVLGLAWVLGFTVFHVASSAIHILLILAVVGVIAHFVRGTARK